jgi:hypothetical protein
VAGAVARPALAAPETVVVTDFDYADSSGEMKDQRAAHAERLRDLQAAIITAVTQGGRFQGAALACATPPCSAGTMDQEAIASAAHAQHARFVVFGGVHKISTLIQWGQVEVMDADSGKAVLSRTVTFRGDSDDAWKHASDYIGQMVAAALP